LTQVFVDSKASGGLNPGPANLLEVARFWLEKQGGSLSQPAEAMSQAYRAGRSSTVLAGDFRAYLAARLPATYAAVSACVTELAARMPAFAPQSLCDAGAGPGTASWTAAACWPTLKHVTMFDNDPAFLALAKELAAFAQPMQQGVFINQDITAVEGTYDLVMASYALAELSLTDVERAVSRLWACAEAALVIVEPGTPQGFARVRLARDGLVKAGACIAAPCVHEQACPMGGADWCRFSVRLPRSRAHMHAKRARMPFEDEPYSYVIAVREKPTRTGARIIAAPAASKVEMKFKLCGENGLEMAAVPTRNRDAYRRARKLAWGDLF
jgi:ribosomal protein RSM22 (predicted rRNA methylase)